MSMPTLAGQLLQMLSASSTTAHPHDKDDECYRVVIEPMSAVYPHDAPRLKNELAGTTFVPT
jgi:hypothetical protein